MGEVSDLSLLHHVTVPLFLKPLHNFRYAHLIPWVSQLPSVFSPLIVWKQDEWWCNDTKGIMGIIPFNLKPPLPYGRPPSVHGTNNPIMSTAQRWSNPLWSTRPEWWCAPFWNIPVQCGHTHTGQQYLNNNLGTLCWQTSLYAPCYLDTQNLPEVSPEVLTYHETKEGLRQEQAKFRSGKTTWYEWFV